MSTTKALKYGSFYHIYNRGNNSEDLFKKDSDYQRFLLKFQDYIPPVAETFAFVLMKNHFHLLVRIKEEDQICPFKNNPVKPFLPPHHHHHLSASNGTDRSTNKTNRSVPHRYPKPDRQLSHLFNAYARYFNIKNNRHGALFERPFRRKLVVNLQYLINLVIYIHNNPVLHGFTNDPADYNYSSYNYYLSDEDSFLKKESVLSWFGDFKSFIQEHRNNLYCKPNNEWFID